MPASRLVAALLLVSTLLAACGVSPAASSAPSEAAPSAPASAATQPSSAASEAAEPSEAAAGLCLSADVRTAIAQIADGNFETDVALDEIADAVEALEVEEVTGDVPFAVDDRDDLVEHLRAAEPTTQLKFAADVFESDLFEIIPEC